MNRFLEQQDHRRRPLLGALTALSHLDLGGRLVPGGYDGHPIAVGAKGIVSATYGL